MPLTDVSVLDGLRLDAARVADVCGRIGSTGLYPWALTGEGDRVVAARQFPRSSGYPEDAATGVAATALAGGLRAWGLLDGRDGEVVTVRQGQAMGRPSQMQVRFSDDHGFWLGGPVSLAG